MTAVPQPRRNRWQRAFSTQNRGRSLFVAATLTPLMLYMLFWTLFPVLWAVSLAFFDYSPGRLGGPLLGFGGDNPFVGLTHFGNMLGDSLEAEQFRTALKNTLIFSFIYLPLNLAVTIPLALAIEAIHQRVKTTFRFVYFLPTVTASVGVALIWGYLYHPQQGLINMALRGGGGHRTHLADRPARGLPRGAAGDVGDPHHLPLVGHGLQPDHLHRRPPGHPAGIPGGGPGGRRQHLAAVLACHAAPPAPTLLFVCVLTMISSFQVFDIIQIMTQGGPQEQTRVLVLDIYLNAFRYQRMGWAGAVSLVLFAMILIITFVQSRLLRTQWEY